MNSPTLLGHVRSVLIGRAICDREQDPAELRELLALRRTDSWRSFFAGRLHSGQTEAWAPRMGKE